MDKVLKTTDVAKGSNPVLSIACFCIDFFLLKILWTTTKWRAFNVSFSSVSMKKNGMLQTI